MCSIEKRKLSEVLFMYTLEPDLKDIYVEGITDRLFYSSVIVCQDVNIVEVDSVDFSELYNTLPHLKRNNRGKIIELSNQFANTFDHNLSNVCCVVDTDFDFFSSAVAWCYYLKYTDFTGLEMYLFNENTLNEFFVKILHGFPISSSIILGEFSNVLVDLFFIRLSIKNCISEEMYSKISFLDIKSSISINKKNGTIEFNSEKHLEKVLNSNALMCQRKDILEHFRSLKLRSCDDNRLQIRGHDFIHLLFLLIDKIKNHIKLTEDTLERILLVCACNDALRCEKLFVDLNKKYCT